VCAFRSPENWVEGYEIVIRPSPSEVIRNVEAQVRQLFSEVAEDLGGRAKEVPVEALAVVESPARALLDQSQDADLLVVGHRRRGALSSAVLGSVGLQCVLHARCPVTVVRAAPAEQPATEAVAAAVASEA
jgi:nucleotide-binding universal stress UspA family protein